MPATDPDQAVHWATGRVRIPISTMLGEIDLTCSDRGGELVERDVDPRTLSLASAVGASITIAECPACGARCFRERSLAPFGPQTGSSRKPGGR